MGDVPYWRFFTEKEIAKLTRGHRPLTLIIPAQSHPDVIVQAIAARDKEKAQAYAKKHGIPEVKDKYEGKLYHRQLLFDSHCKY